MNAPSSLLVRVLVPPAVLLAAACGSSEPPSCEQAVRQGAVVPDAQKGGATNGANLVATCIADKWSPAIRDCVANARTSERFDRCFYAPVPRHKHRRSEGELNLDAIMKSAKVTFVETGAFPRASAPLTPAHSCCGDGGKTTCKANPDEWNGVLAWDLLDFEVSEDHHFQYSYESDGKTYEARAVGDRDCDGQTVTFVMRGRIEDGSPVAELVRSTTAD